MREKHVGSSADDFLKEERIFEEAQAQGVKRSSPGSLPRPRRGKGHKKHHGHAGEERAGPGPSPGERAGRLDGATGGT